MKLCDDCTQARKALWWGGYRATCQGCTARAVARSLACFNAIRNDDTAELREAISRLFPAMPYKDARALVWEWWQHDHPQQEGDQRRMQTNAPNRCERPGR